MSESTYQASMVRTAAQHRLWLFRNNVGTCHAADGRVVRFGLCRGSGDQIGWQEYTVQPEDVGRTLAVFTSLEFKAQRGRVRPEQAAWLEAVRRSGGLAAIAREGMTWDEILQEMRDGR